ncbi:transcriptional regulator NrdR [Aureibacillus halotolerans]|uniref:Transcriptional repressor NrdR n=1 Tax=Aureibacillus halotolerans TaxID=1508390 RepID=A0A4R6U7W7_9BACI|nr:transcriptional regulator NrdR [Aureibacillus halotolerans]TDQ39154.1 transcriptional repressor NrdR [Aureibacillus halotolerans]
MICPNCGQNGSRVLDSRQAEEGRSIRRRRECERCNFRFTTFEKVEAMPLLVIKKEGAREEFSREKMVRGLIKAVEKRPVTSQTLEELSLDVEKELRDRGVPEVSSEEIGEMVMDHLAQIDEVAYVRFASVYRQFKDVNTFLDELKDLIKQEKPPHPYDPGK